jgi:hypothetical protein
MDESREKEIVRLERLIAETAKQKERCLNMFEKDVKKIGAVHFAKQMGCSYVYIYNIFNRKPISPEKLRELWEKAYYFVNTFKLEK